MNTVEPIRDRKKINDIKKYLKLRDYALFVVGINSGLWVSDLLDLKWCATADHHEDIKPQ